MSLKTVTSRKLTSSWDCTHVTLIESCVLLQSSTNLLSSAAGPFQTRKISSMKRLPVYASPSSRVSHSFSTSPINMLAYAGATMAVPCT